MPETLLQGTNLHKHYRMGGEDLHVLRGVDLTVAQGEWLAILGASGSGKSTLLHLLGGLDRPGDGAVAFRGVGIFDQGSRQIDRYRSTQVGFVFQFYFLMPEFTALENVLLAAKICHSPFTWPAARPAASKRAHELLGRLGLGERLRHRPNKLSGGERQRVAIAIALANDPQLLIADEPTTALDVTVQAQVLELLRQLQQQHGLAMLFISHDLAVVGQVAGRVAVMRGGEVVETGPAERLLTRPEHAYTRSLLAAVPTMRTDRNRPLAMIS
jgi:ABC-type glutathione transport system ATPase component